MDVATIWFRADQVWQDAAATSRRRFSPLPEVLIASQLSRCGDAA